MKSLWNNWRVAIFFTGAVAAQAAGLDPALPAFKPSAPLNGKLTVATGDSMRALLEAWTEIFRRAQPGVEVVLDVRDSSYAPKALVAGTAQVGLLGRLLWDEETADLARTWGQPPQRVDVAGATYDDRKKTQALAVFVHRDNPIRGLTFTQLDAIFSETRKRGATKPVITWGDLGLTGDWSAQTVHPVVVKTTVGHALYYRETLLLGGRWKKGLPEFTEDRVVPDGVASDRDAIGLTAVPFGGGGARMVPLSARDGEPFVDPTFENVANRSYPLSRLLYLFVRQASSASTDPLVREFARVALSREGQASAQTAGFLPLPADIVRAELKKLE